MGRNITFNSEGFPEYLNIQKDEVYKFREVTSEELLQIRMSKQPGVVYKKGGILFVATVKRSMSVYTLGKKHLCAEECLRVCRGCPRTRDITVAYQQRIGKSFTQAVYNSWRIEKYDFVIEGIEAFNMGADKDAFFVFSCAAYDKKNRTCKKIDRGDIENAKVKLASTYYEDFNGKTWADFYEWRRYAIFKPIRIGELE